MGASRAAMMKVEVRRKDPDLPAFVVVPSKAVAHWKLTGTTVVEGPVNGYDFGRRTIKAWGKGIDAWFVEFTGPICRAAGLTVGDSVELELRLADTATPQELASHLSSSEHLFGVWSALTDRERREVTEHIRAAKNPATRERRAKLVADRLRGASGRHHDA